MQKLYNILSLQNVLPRPLGLVRYWIFILSFLISRIPLWFVLFAAVLYIGSLNIAQGLLIITAILICRTFVESEMAGGKNSFSFFAILRILRGVYALIIYFFIIFVFTYLLNPENTDNFGKITVILSLAVLPFLLVLEFYNLIYKKPLGNMPNQSSMQAFI